MAQARDNLGRFTSGGGGGGAFNQQVGRWAGATKNRVQAIRKGVTIELFNAVVMSTPVLSGRLRGNWNLSVGQPDRKTNSPEDPSGARKTQEIETGVLATDGSAPVFLTNSLPYAARIEFDGWSHTKALEGMVRINVARFDNLIKEIKT